MKGKRIRTGLLGLLAALTLAGCALTSPVEDLYKLPELPPEYRSLSLQIEAIQAQGAEYAAPTSGTNLQPVQLVDLDGDGVEEAVAFFRCGAEEKPLKIYIFKAEEDSYRQAAVIEGSGTAIHSIRYVDLNSDGRKELLVSWRVETDAQAVSVQAMGVYALENMEPVQLMVSPYARYEAVDFDGDGRMELVVLRGDGTEAGGSAADCYDWEGRGLRLVSTAKLSVTVAQLQGMQVGRLTDGSTAVFVTGLEAESQTVNDILVYQGKELRNIVLSSATGVSTEVFRVSSLQPMDIDGDGVTEIPMPIRLPGDSESLVWKIYWRSYSSLGEARSQAITYHDTANNWYLMIPEEWDWNFTVSPEGVSAVERGATFYSIAGGVKDQPLFTIYACTGSNRDKLAAKPGRTILRSQPGTIYTVVYHDTYETWSLALEPEELAERFHVIVAQWTTGDN